MDCTGRITGIARDYLTGKWTLTLQINEDIRGGYEELKAVDMLGILIKKIRKKRSLDANAYYWVLVSKMSEKLRTSKEEMHNILLSRYGQIDRDEDGNSIIFSLRSDIDISKRYDLHAKPIGKGYVDGKEFTHYALIKGSHLYDTKEMSVLIDGVVSEAKEQGIETMTPDDLKRMKEAWNAKKN